MATDSLFGHLALKFATHPENLATEALAYVLSSAAPARRAVVGLARSTGALVPDDLVFRTQVVGEDEAIPDIVGFDSAGVGRLILEAKFWAGLTDRQPVHYVRRLEGINGGLVLFVAPRQRTTTLWPELVRRCVADNMSVDVAKAPPTGLQTARVDGFGLLALVNWPGLMDVLSVELNAASELRAREDVDQLRGLCDRMDKEAFLPLQSEEFGTLIPRRLMQFHSLVEELVSRSIQSSCNTRGLRTSASAGVYGRYLAHTHSGVGLLLHVDLRKWARVRDTPLWLRVHTPPGVRDVLKPLEDETPPRLITDMDFPANHVSIPLYPPLAVEQEGVVTDLLAQLAHIYALLDGLPAGFVGGTPPEFPDPPATVGELMPVGDASQGEAEPSQASVSP